MGNETVWDPSFVDQVTQSYQEVINAKGHWDVDPPGNQTQLQPNTKESSRFCACVVFPVPQAAFAYMLVLAAEGMALMYIHVAVVGGALDHTGHVNK